MLGQACILHMPLCSCYSGSPLAIRNCATCVHSLLLHLRGVYFPWLRFFLSVLLHAMSCLLLRMENILAKPVAFAFANLCTEALAFTYMRCPWMWVFGLCLLQVRASLLYGARVFPWGHRYIQGSAQAWLFSKDRDFQALLRIYQHHTWWNWGLGNVVSWLIKTHTITNT